MCFVYFAVEIFACFPCFSVFFPCIPFPFRVLPFPFRVLPFPFRVLPWFAVELRLDCRCGRCDFLRHECRSAVAGDNVSPAAHCDGSDFSRNRNFKKTVDFAGFGGFYADSGGSHLPLRPFRNPFAGHLPYAPSFRRACGGGDFRGSALLSARSACVCFSGLRPGDDVS